MLDLVVPVANPAFGFEPLTAPFRNCQGGCEIRGLGEDRFFRQLTDRREACQRDQPGGGRSIFRCVSVRCRMIDASMQAKINPGRSQCSNQGQGAQGC